MATCITTAMMPKRLIANEKAKIQLIRQCPNDVAVTLTTIELRGKGSTFLKFDTPPSTAIVYERKVTEADKPRVEEEITFWVTDNNEPSYALEVVADGKVAQATFDRNWLGALPGFLRLLITAAGAVPALLGLLMAFYADARTLLEKLLSRAREAH